MPTTIFISERSPVYSHVSETINGLQTVRAFRMEGTIVRRFETYQDKHTTTWFLFLATYRWFGIRSLLLVVIFMNAVIYSAFLFRDREYFCYSMINSARGLVCLTGICSNSRLSNLSITCHRCLFIVSLYCAG